MQVKYMFYIQFGQTVTFISHNTDTSVLRTLMQSKSQISTRGKYVVVRLERLH